VARTPLLGALQRLAEEHRTGARLGIEPAELRGRRSEAAYSRGEFLKRAGVAGAAIAVAGPAAFSRSASAATAPRIAIVGGGIAGLTAALTLADKGVAATVYEASAERIGGRMHSDTGYWDGNQVSEFCGELIDSNHHTILQLAQRFGLATSDLLAAEPNGSDTTYWFLGGYYSAAQADKDFQPIHHTLTSQVQAAGYPTTYQIHTDAGAGFDAMTLYDWIEAYVPGKHASAMGRLLDAAYNEEYGADTKDQSALNLIYLLGFNQTPGNFEIFGASNERYHIAGGNQQLPEAIAAYLGRQHVNPGWRMTAISQANGVVTMQFDTPTGAKTVQADHVILCMSFSVLRTLDTAGAQFDSLKQTAITQLGSGHNAKLQLQFASRYWNTQGAWGLSNGDVYTDLPSFQNAWDVTRAQSGGTGILVNYSGGSVANGFRPSSPYSNAATSQQVTTYAKAWLNQLEVVFPGIAKLWNGSATLSTPFLDPNLNCSYSYWKPGQYVGFSGYEGKQMGSIHFAGEHCSQNFQGFMEGGAAEGVRAASEILAALKK
jgi:monoamine oxidase